MQLNENSELSRFDWAASVLPALLTANASKLVWDIGAGAGDMQARVEAAGGVYRGLDLFPARPEISRWDLDEPPPTAGTLADGALLLEVLEHCNNPGRALGHIAAALQPGGFLVMTMPNPRWSRSRLSAVLSGYPTCFTQSDLDQNHHVFTTWPHIVERFLHDAGFAIERYVTLDGQREWPGRPFNLRYPVRWVVAAAMKAIERRDPTGCGMSYGVVARKTRAES